MARAIVGDIVDDVLMPEAQLVGAFTARRKGSKITMASDEPSSESPDTDRPDFGKRYGRRVVSAVKRATRPLGKRRD